MGGSARRGTSSAPVRLRPGRSSVLLRTTPRRPRPGGGGVAVLAGGPLGAHAPSDGRDGHVAVKAFVGGHLATRRSWPKGLVHFHERPQHRSVVAVGGAAPVVQQGVGDDASPLPIGRRTSGIQSSGRHSSPRRASSRKTSAVTVSEWPAFSRTAVGSDTPQETDAGPSPRFQEPRDFAPGLAGDRPGAWRYGDGLSSLVGLRGLDELQRQGVSVGGGSYASVLGSCVSGWGRGGGSGSGGAL